VSNQHHPYHTTSTLLHNPPRKDGKRSNDGAVIGATAAITAATVAGTVSSRWRTGDVAVMKVVGLGLGLVAAAEEQ